jgi:hypothetical protein
MTYELEPWTLERFKYEFFLYLTKISDTNGSNSVGRDETRFLSDRKYYAQANKLIYRIPISKPSPPFVINFSDLTPRLQSELQEFCKLNAEREIATFLKEIAFRFFEGINYAYAHDSVLSCLTAVLER